MRLQIIFFIFFLFVGKNNFAQINNQLLENIIEVKDSNSQKVMLNIQAKPFFKNNEYFGKISTGYTLFGAQLGTQLAFQPSPYVRIQAGAYFLKDYGNDTAMHVRPLLTCKIEKNGYSFLFGNLEGNFAHRLIEPLYNYERYITNPLENGIQFKINKDKIWSDTWMNWEVMQYLGSNYQEQFSAGHHSDITIFHKNKSMFTLPFMFLFAHKGGQIDIDTTQLKTLFNAAIGFQYEYKAENKTDFIKSFSTQNYFTIFKDLSPDKYLNFNKGSAFYFNATLCSKYDISASAGYWSAHNFLSSRGGYLFQSEASIYGKQGYLAPDRSLLFFRILYARKVFDAINVNVRFEPYYDFIQQLFEYNYSVYFSYHHDFSLFNFARKK